MKKLVTYNQKGCVLKKSNLNRLSIVFMKTGNKHAKSAVVKDISNNCSLPVMQNKQIKKCGQAFWFYSVFI